MARSLFYSIPTTAILTLYLMPDLNDLSSRVQITSGDDSLPTAQLILLGSCTLVLVYVRPKDDSTPVKLPSGLVRDRDAFSNSSTSSRGIQQTNFAASLFRLSGGHEALTGAKLLHAASGQHGVDWEAAHIIPVAGGRYGTIEARHQLLEGMGLEGNLYIPSNGMPLSKQNHAAFDAHNLSIDVENGYRIVVWPDVPTTRVELHALHNTRASFAIPGGCLFGAAQLLRWHHAECHRAHLQSNPKGMQMECTWIAKHILRYYSVYILLTLLGFAVVTQLHRQEEEGSQGDQGHRQQCRPTRSQHFVAVRWAETNGRAGGEKKKTVRPTASLPARQIFRRAVVDLVYLYI
jgi:hypothetical protein